MQALTAPAMFDSKPPTGRPFEITGRTSRRIRCARSAALLAALAFLSAPASAQDRVREAPGQEKQQQDDDQQKRFERFIKQMNGVKLVGNFTILGRESGELPKEEYVIRKVSKLPDGDKWLFNAQVNYGKYDVPVSLPLDVKWAGDTPVITLTDLTIPILGTFSARVVLYNKKYAGTWTHGKAGGHLFGVIEQIEEEE